MERSRWCLVLLCLFASVASAELNPADDEDASPNRVLTLDSIASQPQPLWPKTWEVHAAPGVIFDNNINHVLINSIRESNIREPDTIFYTQAGVASKPDWGENLIPFFRYDFERYDYQNHSDFSYYDHQLYGSLNYWFLRHWAVDTGLEGDWYADDSGLVTDDQVLHSGLRFEKNRFRGRFGYAFERDGYVFNNAKDSHINNAYAEISHPFLRRQSWFVAYNYAINSASDNIYSYRSHWGELGWVNGWNNRFRVLWLGTYIYTPYRAFDDRFLAVRQDHTYSFTVKPSFAIYPSLRLITSFSYLVNYSNVEIKRYVDQIYSVLLEARL